MIGSGGSSFLRFSRPTILATNGMVALANLASEESLDASKVAERVGADVAEMRSVLAHLQKVGLVERTANGRAAFRLRGEADAVSLYDIANAMGEDFDICRCVPERQAPGDSCLDCALLDVSRQVRSDVIALLKSRTIGELVMARA